MTDFLAELDAVHRELGRRRIPAGDGRSVVLRRRYGAPIEDVWDAVTNPDRLKRWFLPVSGDLRLGGTYQIEGNASGEILRCDPPHLLLVTWVFGEAAVSEVEVRLSPADDGATLLELDHAAVTDPALWPEYGPGATGVGWDLALLGLSLHLQGGSLESDPSTWHETPEGRAFITGSSKAWGSASEAAGTPPAEAATAAANTTAFYAPE
jgi:uncharacterized protein YndB with AHSA1/START domain